MRECPNCGELNGDSNTNCYKCGKSIGPISSTKKICPSCCNVYIGNKDTCDRCGDRLVSYDERYYLEQSYNKSNSSVWLYVCTVLIPLIGIVVGCVKIANDSRDDSGKPLIILGVVLTIVYSVITALLL